MPAVLEMWVIYERPRDYPRYFVTRRQLIGPGYVRPDPDCTLHETLDEARAAIPQGLYCLGRAEEDEPHITEVWI